MKEKNILLSVNNLKTYFYTEGKTAKAVDGVTFNINQGEILGIVGESGSGKTITSLSILRLIPDPPGKIVSGEILFNKNDILKLEWDEVRKIRGNKISMIFQEPMTSLNPVFTIGSQLIESIILHQKLSKKDAIDKAVNLMDKIGIPSPHQRINDYPHQFSGGMRQRVMIAMALSCEPDLLIADEPTTALDVTVQAQILDLMIGLKNKSEHNAILLITHNMAVIAETCDRVIVMYCGKIQEISSKADLFKKPLHPYTQGLLKAIPSITDNKKKLFSISGNVPDIYSLPSGCTFNPRCQYRFGICDKEVPDLYEAGKDHFVRCHLFNKDRK